MRTEHWITARWKLPKYIDQVGCCGKADSNFWHITLCAFAAAREHLLGYQLMHRLRGFDAQQNTFNVGAGLEFYSTANMKFSVNYDYEMKEDYDGHNGYVRAGVKF